MRTMRLEQRPDLELVVVMLDWQAYYDSLGRGKKEEELVGKPTHTVIYPKKINFLIFILFIFIGNYI